MNEMFDISYQGAAKLYLENYTIPKQYHNSFEQHRPVSKNILDMSMDEKKNAKQIKKLDFLHEIIKEQSYKPGPGAYLKTQKWKKNQENELPEKKHKKINFHKLQEGKQPGKPTVFTDLQNDQKKYKYPSPAQYKVNTSSFTLNSSSVERRPKKIKNMEGDLSRETYLDGLRYREEKSPGPGRYNPHDPKEIKRVFVDRRDQKYWIEKHLKQSKSNKKKNLRSLSPGVGQYTPIPVNFNTFQNSKSKSPARVDLKNFQTVINKLNSRSKSPKQIGINNLPHLGFGVSPRKCQFDSNTKSQVGFHNLNMQWGPVTKLPFLKQEKRNEQDQKKINYFNIKSKPVHTSIYYS